MRVEGGWGRHGLNRSVFEGDKLERSDKSDA